MRVMMYRSTLAKKLKPAKKAWNSFTNKLRSKLQKLTTPKAIKETTHRLFAFVTLHFMLLFKRLSLTTKPSYYRRHDHQQSYLYQNQLQNNFRAVYIDRLYAEPAVSVQLPAKQVSGYGGETSRGKDEVREEKPPFQRKGSDSMCSVEEAWNAIVAKSPQLRGVDERAEEFISNFRQDMKLQKERSDVEFQQMLARSA